MLKVSPGYIASENNSSQPEILNLRGDGGDGRQLHKDTLKERKWCLSCSRFKSLFLENMLSAVGCNSYTSLFSEPILNTQRLSRPVKREQRFHKCLVVDTVCWMQLLPLTLITRPRGGYKSPLYREGPWDVQRLIYQSLTSCIVLWTWANYLTSLLVFLAVKWGNNIPTCYGLNCEPSKDMLKF